MNTKQKAIVLLVCSALGNNFIFNNHAMAMKSLKKIFSSVPSEEKIMKLAYAKLSKITVDLSKSDEEKLATHVNSIVLPGGYIRVMNDKGKILTINPLVFHINRYNKVKFNNEKFMSIVNWVKVHIPEAFNPSATPENKITGPQSPLIFTMETFKTSKLEVASTICNALIPFTDLSKEYSVEIEPSIIKKNKVIMNMNAFDLAQCEKYKSLASTVPAFSSNQQVLFSHAVLSGNIDEVTKAIFAGADVNSKVYVKPYGRINPLDLALINRNEALFDCLIRHGAKVSEGSSVLELVFREYIKDIDKFWGTRSNISFLEKVLTCDKLSVTWNAKYTDFFEAGEVWESHIIREFVTKRAGITKFALNDIVRNKRLTEDKKIEAVNFIFQNQTPTSERLNFDLNLAIGDCNWKLARLLIEKGASVDDPTLDSSPLGEAVFAPTREFMENTSRVNALITKEWVQFIRFLVNDCKASISNAMSSGNGLCHAFERFFFADVHTPQKQNLVLEVAEFLIEKGMNLNAVDSRGKTLLGGWVAEQQIEEERLLSTMGTRLYNLFVQNGAKKYI